jgi:hypothetical protein
VEGLALGGEDEAGDGVGVGEALEFGAVGG